ncbi:P-loop containing nucleoside triphosphate hydrolase protein [Myxozyma melibiosi]|uniref:ATP-dependent RNA helicase DBP10 n=1 Tax=Myxozyma melibiosi TaxID=54550 RepID=A0ABR1EY93_9ASCO
MSDSESEYDISNAIASFNDAAAAGGDSSDDDSVFDDVQITNRKKNLPLSTSSSATGSNSVVQTQKKQEKPKPKKMPALTAVGSDEDEDEDDEAEFFKNLPVAGVNGGVGADGKMKKLNPGKFNALGLSQQLVRNVHRKGYNTPTPIQRKTIPLVLNGVDVVGMARTGSGKTAAFVLPMIEKLKAHSAKVGARAIVLSPSRELALQTLKVVKEFSRGTDLKCILLVGGDSLEDQFGWMMTNPDIIIATPGRFAHLKVEMDLDLKSVEYIVFDEADRLFELGFSMQLMSILASLPASRQTLLFSATLPKSLVEFARAGLSDPVLVRLDADSKISDELEMFFFSIKSSESDGALLWLLRDVIKMPTAAEMPKRDWKFNNGSDSDKEDNGEDEHDKKKKKFDRKKSKFSKPPSGNEATSPHATIVFAPTRHHVEYVANLLREFGYAISYIYGSLDQHARREQLAMFRAGVTSILVVTDVAARGIDVPILANVVNYSFPGSPKVFVHRVGRTARAGKRGRAFSLVKETEVPYLLDLELFLGKSLKLPSDLETLAAEEIDYTRDMVCGSFPRDELERSCEDVQTLLTKDYDLSSLRQVAIKGEKLYLKTRGSASSESVRRAKEVIVRGWDTLAPMFREHELAERENMLQRLARFRPAETIFEVTRKGGVNADSAADLMRRRRFQVAPIQKYAKAQGTLRWTAEDGEESQSQSQEMEMESEMEQVIIANDEDEEEIEQSEDAEKLASATEDEILNTFKLAPEKPQKRKRDSSTISSSSSSKKTKPTTFRDEAHYISHYAPSEMAQDRGYGVNTTANNATSVISFMDNAASASFDLGNDDPTRSGSGIIGSNRTKLTKWDKKKHKYVTKQAGDDAEMGGKKGKMIRGENGVRLPATYKSGRFESWKAANKKKDGVRVGQSENPRDAAGGAGPQNRRYKHKEVKAPKAADKFRDNYMTQNKKFKQAMEKGVVAPQGARNELKSAMDIRKARKLKERRKEKNARPSKKRR